MDVTMTNNLIIPQVVADLVDSKLGERLSLLPITEVDNSLSGKPGDTLQFPAFRYIGKAEQVDENGRVQAGVLSADTVSATVKKYAKAVRITDEARLSGFGDPVGEAARQLAHAIDHAVDDALFETLREAGWDRKAAVPSLSSESVAEALTLFGEQQDGPKVLLTDAEGFARLRLDPHYLRQGDLAQQQVFSGAVGEIWGCQIVISQKIGLNPATGEKQHYILKPGALRLVNKTGTMVEIQREPDYMRDTIYCSKHCASYLYDAGRVAVLTEYLGLQTLAEGCGIRTEPASTGCLRILIPDALQAPRGLKWVHRLSNEEEAAGQYGTALSGTADYQGSLAEVAVGEHGYLHLYLVDAGLKPVKQLSLAAMGGI